MTMPYSIAFISAKGGAGKTTFALHTSYLLAKTGKKVAYIDTDTATSGGSIFILGPNPKNSRLHISSENCFAESMLHSLISTDDVTPSKITHDGDFDILFSTKSFLDPPDRRGEIESFISSIDIEDYFKHIQNLDSSLKKEYDYLIWDTRGGFDHKSITPAVIVDEFIMLLEPDEVSYGAINDYFERLKYFCEQTELSDVQQLNNKFGGFILNKSINRLDEPIFDSIVSECKVKYQLPKTLSQYTLGITPLDIDFSLHYRNRKISATYDELTEFGYCFSNYIFPKFIDSTHNLPKDEEKFNHIKTKTYLSWYKRKRWLSVQDKLIILSSFLIIFMIPFQFSKSLFPEYFFKSTTLILSAILLATAASMIIAISITLSKRYLKNLNIFLFFGFFGFLLFARIVYQIPDFYRSEFDYENISKQNNKLETENYVLQQKTVKFNQIEKKNDRLQTKNQDYRAKIKQQIIKTINFEKDITTKESEITRLSLRYEVMETLNTHLNKNIKTLYKTIDQYQQTSYEQGMSLILALEQNGTEMEILREKIDKYNQQISKQKKSNKILEKERDNLTSEKMVLEEKINTLRKKIEKNKKQHQHLTEIFKKDLYIRVQYNNSDLRFWGKRAFIEKWPTIANKYLIRARQLEENKWYPEYILLIMYYHNNNEVLKARAIISELIIASNEMIPIQFTPWKDIFNLLKSTVSTEDWKWVTDEIKEKDGMLLEKIFGR